ncbi:proton-coupled amino acid transporter-like protein pathetic [Lycorma delicatula]|uniref:proton-coupled amino acid transporter-like protein pathetic n=1 Tax=Lycorma delicatula TaxID=130591 RepID=UPI003F5139CE
MYMISSILKEVLSYQSKVQVINTRWYSIILLVIFLPVGFIRQIKYLVPFCPLASIFVLFSVLVVLYNNIQDLPPLSSRQHMGSVTDIPSFFFGVLFALQTTFVFLPLRTSVKYNKHYRQCPGVLCISISIIAFMYIIFGFFGYLKYGENTNAVNLFNLNHNGLSETIKIFIILSVLLSYNFQLIGAMDVVWNNIEHKFSAKYKTLLYYVIKDLLIVSTVIIVSFSLNLFPLLSLVGSLTLSTLCVILPLIIETITFWDITLGRWNWKLYKNILLTIISFVLTTVACVKSFSKIIEKY